LPPLPAFDNMFGSVATEHRGPSQDDAARWRSIVESAVDGIIVFDHGGRIELFNPAAERMFGYRAEEVLGHNVSMLMPEPHAAEHDHYLERYLATRVPHIIGIGRDIQGRRKDGSTFPAHLSVGEIPQGGQSKFTGIVRDLTERVNLEARLRDEAGLARVGELAAVLAHEVRNPLAAVSGAMQILGEKLTAAEDREIVEEALRRLDALSAMMTDLLVFARPPKPRFVLLDVSALAESLVGFLRMDPAWGDVECRVEGRVSPVMADAELLKVALQNLLLNALHAMGGRGSVEVVMTEVGGTVNIDIRDSGSGIPSEIQPRLFTPFFTTKARGTGLGLATVRRIARGHHGDVAVLSTGAGGTTIRLSLPARRLSTE
jgi:two-component system sensor kinase FixL